MKIKRLVNEKVLVTFLCSMISLLTLSNILSHFDINDKTTKVKASVNEVEKVVKVDTISEYSKQSKLTEPPKVEEVKPVQKTYTPVVIPQGSVGEYQAYAYSQFGRYGWSEEDMQCLIQLWNRESGWNPGAQSRSGAYGIPQALPGSKMAAYGSDYLTNYATQINWGLDYISARYGSPTNAWNNFVNKGWY